MAKVVGTRERTVLDRELEVVIAPGGIRDVRDVTFVTDTGETYVALGWEGTTVASEASKPELACVRCSLESWGKDFQERNCAADLITPADSVAAARLDRIESMLLYLLGNGPRVEPDDRLEEVAARQSAWERVRATRLVKGMRQLGWKEGMWMPDHRKFLLPVLVGPRASWRMTVDTTEVPSTSSFVFRLTVFGVRSVDRLSVDRL